MESCFFLRRFCWSSAVHLSHAILTRVQVHHSTSRWSQEEVSLVLCGDPVTHRHLLQ